MFEIVMRIDDFLIQLVKYCICIISNQKQSGITGSSSGSGIRRLLESAPFLNGNKKEDNQAVSKLKQILQLDNSIAKFINFFQN
jgi:hypothetical protein